MGSKVGPVDEANGSPEQALVVALSTAVAACRAAGQDHAARVAWRALGELLAQPGARSPKVASISERGEKPEADESNGE